MTVRRRWAPWVWVALVLAPLGGFAMAAQPWWQVRHPAGVVEISGSESVAGLPTALAAVLGAGVLLCLALRRWGRLVLGVVLIVTAMAAIVVGIVSPEPSDAVVARLVQAATLEPAGPPERSWGGYGFAAAGLLGLVGAVGLLILEWQRRRSAATARGGRFTRDSAPPEVAPNDDPLTVWRALDEGRDPTTGEEPKQPPRPT